MRNIKIVHTADWHIGRSLNDYSLLADQRDYFSRFITRMEELNPDIMLIAGDLYDRSVPSSEAVRLLNDILNELAGRLKIPVFAVAGNHDSKDRLSFGSAFLEKNGLYIAGTLTPDIKKVSLEIAGQAVNIYLLPYFEPYNIKGFFPNKVIKSHDEAMKLYTESMLKNLDTSALNVLVGHGLYGAGGIAAEETAVGGSEMIDASIFSSFDYVALGHLHSCRTAGSDRIRFSGSPLKYSIDEATQSKGFCVIEINKQEHCFSFSQECLPPLHDVIILEGEFDYFLTLPACEDYVFLQLTDKSAVLNAIARLKVVFPNILGLKYLLLELMSEDDTLIRQKNQEAALSPLQLFKSFYQTVTDEPLSAKQSEYVVEVFDNIDISREVDL